jgi:hypothetical protein
VTELLARLVEAPPDRTELIEDILFLLGEESRAATLEDEVEEIRSALSNVEAGVPAILPVIPLLTEERRKEVVVMLQGLTAAGLDVDLPDWLPDGDVPALTAEALEGFDLGQLRAALALLP